MADVPIGAVPAPAAEVVAPSPMNSAKAAQAARAAKIAEVTKGIAKLSSEKPAEAKTESPAASVDAVAEAPASPSSKTADAPSTEAAPVKPEPKVDETPDAKTAKSLALVDKRMAEFREEQKKAKAEFAAEIQAEREKLAKERADIGSKGGSLDELRRLAKSTRLEDRLAALEKLGYDNEDDYALLGRAAYTRTKEGKADPRAKPLADQTAKEREYSTKMEELQSKIDQLQKEFETRDQKAASQQFIEKYLDDAVKAIPTEPTLIGKLHAKSPQKARQAMLEIGARMEKSEGETPTHAEVIAEYEKQRRAELEEQGVDVDALLKPSTATKTTTAPSRTLDPTAPSGTRPANPNASRAEKLKAASQGLHKLWQSQPD